MKYFPVVILFFLVISCSNEKKVNSFLNETNLTSTFVNVKASADTTIILQKGGIIKIEKGTFENDVELEIKEAYSMSDILLAGLITESNGHLLQSGGMIYINTKGKETVKLNKPVDVSIPTSQDVPGMKLYKGEVKDGNINWLEDANLGQAPDECITRGRYIFRRNCSSCHGITKALSGPALAGVTERGPWKNRSNIYKWIHNPAAFLRTTAYTKNLQRQFNGALMPAFPALDDSSINCILSFIEKESKKSAKDPSRFDLQPAVKHIWLGKDTLINVWPDGSDTIVFKPDTSLNFTDPIEDTTDGTQIIDDYYEFNIKTLGWYNIDKLVNSMPGVVNCQLSVNTAPTNDSVVFSCFLVLPKRKILEHGYEGDNGRYFFERNGDGHIPLYLDEPAMILVVGVSPGKEVFYGIKHFTTAKKQVVSVAISGPVSKQEFNQVLKSQKLDDIGFGFNR